MLFEPARLSRLTDNAFVQLVGPWYCKVPQGLRSRLVKALRPHVLVNSFSRSQSPMSAVRYFDCITGVVVWNLVV